MLYQWVVLSCSARKRVIGGSLRRRSSGHSVSQTAPMRQAVLNGIDFSTGGAPAAASRALSTLRIGMGWPLETK